MTKISVDRVLEILSEQRREHLRLHGEEFIETIDEIRDKILTDVARPAPTEQPQVTPIGGHLAVKPLGSPDPQGVTWLNEEARETVALTVQQLNDTQRAALLALAEQAPKYRAGIVPTGRFAHPSTATALSSRCLTEWRSFPNKGYKLTDWGNAAVAALRTQ